MCIRDRCDTIQDSGIDQLYIEVEERKVKILTNRAVAIDAYLDCLLYTSYAFSVRVVRRNMAMAVPQMMA